MHQADTETGLGHRARDINSVKWANNNRDLLVKKEQDIGYRLIIADV